MEALTLIARIVFCLLFAASAVGHFAQTDAMAGYAQSKGVPNAKPMVLLGGVALALGTVSILFGIWGDLGALALILFLVPTAFTMHAFWKESEPQARQMEQVQFLKDISLAGAALAFFVLYATIGYGLDIVITDPVFDLR